MGRLVSGPCQKKYDCTMGLIPVSPEDISVGHPLPWMVYDQEGKQLLPQGAVLTTAEQRFQLLIRQPMRELSWGEPGAAAQAEAPEPEALESRELETALEASSENTFSFHDMRLKVGDKIQLQPPTWAGQNRHVVKLIGYLDNQSLLVSAPVENGMLVPLREKDRVIARFFSSQKAFGFSCTIERVCKIPYNYLHLSFPAHIQGSVIRKSPRIRTHFTASLVKPDARYRTETHDGVIINLSADGAMIKTRQPLYEKSDEIQLTFRVKLHNVGAHLALNAVVRNVLHEDIQSQGVPNAPRFNYGIQFQNLPPNDSVILQSLIYQQMIEQPQSLI